MYYTAEVKYKKPNEEGGDDDMTNISSEKYLVEAVSVTDAEAKMTGWKPDNYHEFEVKAAGIQDLDSVITEGDSEQYWLSRIFFPTETPKGKIKWASFQAMVNGENINEALKNVQKEYEGESTSGYEVRKIEFSKIIVDLDLL